jgi:hypothetical protein
VGDDRELITKRDLLSIAILSLYDIMIGMIRQAQKVRIYPTDEQKQQLAGAMGCCRWWWNYALSKSIETYKETGKGLSRAGLNALLPNLKKEHEWLKTEVYSLSTGQKLKVGTEKGFHGK